MSKSCAFNVVGSLLASGVQISVDRGDLVLMPRSRVPEELIPYLRYHKQNMMQFLSGHRACLELPYDETVQLLNTTHEA
jgi:hypothetical protein